MPARVVATIFPSDALFEAKVREAIASIGKPVDWENEEHAHRVTEKLRETFPDADIFLTQHPLNAPTWNIYRDGPPRRIAIE